MDKEAETFIQLYLGVHRELHLSINQQRQMCERDRRSSHRKRPEPRQKTERDTKRTAPVNLKHGRVHEMKVDTVSQIMQVR